MGGINAHVESLYISPQRLGYPPSRTGVMKESIAARNVEFTSLKHWREAHEAICRDRLAQKPSDSSSITLQ